MQSLRTEFHWVSLRLSFQALGPVRVDISDLGGKREHFAPIPRDDDKAFLAAWERSAFGMTMIVGAALVGRNVDAMRASMERLPATRYFESYWGRWMGGLELELERQGVMAPGELAAAMDARAPSAVGSVRPTLARRLFSHLAVLVSRPLPRWMLAAGTRVMSGTRGARRGPRFAVGEVIRGVRVRPEGHTRIPGYVCGKLGTVVGQHGAMAFPDTRARFQGDAPQHLYTVRFEGRELWGAEAEASSWVCVDLFESYMEAP